jgi:hypothetical protein
MIFLSCFHILLPIIIIFFMKRANLSNDANYQAIVEGIDSICRVNHVDATHGLPHALKIAA